MGEIEMERGRIEMTYTDNPIADFNRWDAEQQTQLDRLPHCAYCGEPIQDEFCYYINDETICPDCMECYRRSVDDCVE